MVEVWHLENLPKKLPIFIAEIPSFLNVFKTAKVDF